MGAEGSWEAAGVKVEPAGFQRAIRSLPVPWDRRHFLSPLAWKLWSIAPPALSFPHLLHFHLSARSPAAPLSCRLLSASYQSEPGGDPPPFHLTVPAPVSFAAPSGSVLICFHTAEEKPHLWGSGRAPWHRDQGHCRVPVSPHARCWSWGWAALLAWLGARGVLGGEGPARTGLLGDGAQPNACPMSPMLIPHSQCSLHDNELPFDCAFVSPVFFFFPSF